MKRTATALCLLVGSLALSSCSGDSAPDSSLPVLSLPQAAEAAPGSAPSGTAAPERAATSPGASKAASPGASRATAAAPTNADGQTYALLTSLGSDLVVRYDKVDFLRGACAKRTESQYGDPAATLRVCFSNVNTQKRTVQVSRDVVIGYWSQDGGTEGADQDYAGLREDYSAVRDVVDLPVRLTIKGGVVTRIDMASLLAG